MKRIVMFLICLLSGCATSNDAPTMALMIERMNKLEKQAQVPAPREMKVEEEPKTEPRDYYNAYPGRLNDAQKDFIQFMLNYLSDED